VEEFWQMYNNTYRISQIIPNTDYLFFKKGIRPEWEHPLNYNGGKWVVTLPIEDDMEEECELAWESLLLHMIGCLFEEEEDELINGAVFSIRDKHHRMSLWLKDNNYVGKLKKIGLKFKEICNLPEKYKFGYQVHKKALSHELDNEAFLQI